jgi:hypothetical protein
VIMQMCLYHHSDNQHLAGKLASEGKIFRGAHDPIKYVLLLLLHHGYQRPHNCSKRRALL